MDLIIKKTFNEYCYIYFLFQFADQKITPEVLKILTPFHINKLFTDLPVGDQAIFENKLANWKKSFIADAIDFNFSAPSKPTKNNISVKEVLNTTHNGKEIQAFYNKHGKLYEEQRSLLITTITKFVEGNGIDCSLSDCTELEKEICSIFPSEEIVRINLLFAVKCIWKYTNKINILTF